MNQTPESVPPPSWPPPAPWQGAGQGPGPWQQGPWQVRPGPPGTVQAAAIITYVCCGLSVLMTLGFLLMAAFIGSVVFDDLGGVPDVSELVVLGLLTAGLSLGVSALACWFAWKTRRRESWARIALATCAGLAAVLSLLTFGPHTLVVAPGGIAVLVLLFVPASNAWFGSGAGSAQG